MVSSQRVDRLPSVAYPPPRVGGAHLKPGELAGPGRRYGNLPGTLAAVVRAPELEAVTDGDTPLVLLTLPESVLTALARAVHLGTGPDGARAFARVATGDREALRGLLADPTVREALQLTLTAADAEAFGQQVDTVAGEAVALADDIVLARTLPDPDDERDNNLADELFGMGR